MEKKTTFDTFVTDDQNGFQVMFSLSFLGDL